MKKIIYILTENLNLGVIKSQVISHINFLEENKIAKVDILFCYWSSEELRKTKEFLLINKNLNFSVYFLRIYRPLLFFFGPINRNRIKYKLDKLEKFDYIHARTDFCVSLVKNLKKHGAKIIWDCRGDSAAELDHSKFVMFKDIRKKILDYRFFSAIKVCSKIICVSSFLKKKIKKNTQKYKKIFVIPSVASKKLFYYDPKLRNRTRKSLLLKQKTVVFIYVGGLQNYQKFPNTLNAYERLRYRNKNSVLIILTQDLSIPDYISSRDDIIIKSVDIKQVNRFLNAADYGFCIRDNNEANKAGSPTKFAEYCLTGLDIITSKPLKNYIYSDESVNNIFDYKDFDIKLKSNLQREKIANYYNKRVSRESFKKAYIECYD